MKTYLLLAGIFCFGLSSLSYAQNASISGTVNAEDQDPIYGAYILLKPLSANTKTFATISNKEGDFELSNLKPGKYLLTVQSLGFQQMVDTLWFQEHEQKHVSYELKEKLYETETLVVTASRTQINLEDVSVPISVIDRQEIELTGGTRLSDILVEQTGMNLVSDHGTGIQVQGFDPDYTLILIDNQPVIGRSAGTLDLDRLAVGDVKQIEIVKGPSSALWGSDALAGVINIITEKGQQPLKWSVNGRFGSNTSFDGSTNASFKTDKWSGQFFGNTNGSAGYDLNPQTAAPTVPEYHSYTFSGGLDFDATQNIELGIQSRFYREDLSYVSEILMDGAAELVDSDEFQENFSITPTFSFNVGSHQLFEASAYLSRFDSESSLIISDTDVEYDQSNFDQRLHKYEIKSSTFWDEDHTTILGAGLNHEELVSANYADVPSFNSYFSFGQHEWKLNQELSLTAGFRFDAHSEYSSQFSPKFSGLYKPNDLIHIRASLGGGFKAPEFRQLFLNFTNAQVGYSVFGSSTVVEGVEQLQREDRIQELLIDPATVGEIEAEHSFAYNIGFDLFPTKEVDLKVNLFRNNVKDLIETQRIAVLNNNQPVFSYFNLNNIYTQGIETEVNVKPEFLHGFRFSVGYQFLDAQREIEREFDDVVNGEVITITQKEFIPLFNRSKHTWNAKLFYVLDNLGLESSLRLQYRGRYWYADNIRVNNRIEEEEWSESHLIINASLAKKFGERWKLQAGINNLTNYQNASFLPSNPGITFYTQLNINIY